MPHTFCRVLGQALLATFLLAPLVAYSNCQLGRIDIPVSMSGQRVVAMLRVNGTPVPLAVDSGAFFSFLTEAAAEQLKLRLRPAYGLRVHGLTGRVDVKLTDVAKLGFHNTELSNVEFLVSGDEPGGGTMGWLGRNLLTWADTEYDLANGAIRIVRPQGDCGKTRMAYWADSTTAVATVRLQHEPDERFPAIRVPVRINGRTFEALLDTGAWSILSRSAARRAGLLEDEKKLIPAGVVRGMGRGELPSWLVPVESFEIGDQRITSSRLRIADFNIDDADMLIGIDFFLSHRIYVAYSQGRMYFTHHGGPVFDLSFEAATPVQATPP